MFTGIITDVGEVRHVEKRGDMRARIGTAYDTSGIDVGASIACDGVCLTVVALGNDWFDVDISAETRDKSNLGNWMSGQRVNLERALRVGDELGGHIVSGHVDGLAEVIDQSIQGDSTFVRFRTSQELSKYLAPKGSAALNGTSLTINSVDGREFTINLIPHTKAVTNWDEVGVGSHVNLEVDTIARYVARLHDWVGL